MSRQPWCTWSLEEEDAFLQVSVSGADNSTCWEGRLEGEGPSEVQSDDSPVTTLKVKGTRKEDPGSSSSPPQLTVSPRFYQDTGDPADKAGRGPPTSFPSSKSS